jgi:type II secretory pathway pseudopilin PulG
MNPSIQSFRANRAFTLTDLLMLIAILALLAIVTVPALAGIQNKGGRLECANNLRQIGMESMVYAQENKGWLPIMTLGAANGGNGSLRNHMNGLHYTRYLYIGGTPSTQITTNEPPNPGNGYQNLGYLFQDAQAGNGNIFFCPAMWGTATGANFYSPLLTTDSSGIILSSYFYNPRVTSFTGNPIRRYQTVNQLEPHKLFAVDAINSNVSSGVNVASIPHIRDRGWNVLFTDGAVQFSRITQSNNSFFKSITTVLTDTSYQAYDQTFNLLEQDH